MIYSRLFFSSSLSWWWLLWLWLLVTTSKLTTVVVVVVAQEALPARCGDCWCNNFDDNGVAGDCPTFEDGTISVSLSAPVADAYASFQLVNAPSLRLADENGNSNCFPFVSLNVNAEISSRFPLSLSPPCFLSEARQAPVAVESCDGGQEGEDFDSMVCAFRFLDMGEGSGELCQGRQYELVTYANADCAQQNGAVMAHQGACGVCSSAQDLAVSQAPNSDTATVPCVAAFSASALFGGASEQDFQTLVDCTMEKTGYSLECSRLWSYRTATIALLCTDLCFAFVGGQDDEAVFEAPQCRPADCVACAQDNLEEDFGDFAGWTLTGSGLLSPSVVEKCDRFTGVVHNPCATAATSGDDDKMPPPILATASGKRARCDKSLEKVVKKFISCWDKNNSSPKKCGKRFRRSYDKAKNRAEKKNANDLPCEFVPTANAALNVVEECSDDEEKDPDKDCVQVTMNFIRDLAMAS